MFWRWISGWFAPSVVLSHFSDCLLTETFSREVLSALLIVPNLIASMKGRPLGLVPFRAEEHCADLKIRLCRQHVLNRS